MKTVLVDWFRRYFSNPEAAILFIFLLIGIVGISILSNMLAPLFASVVIAYLLDWGVNFLQRFKCPHTIAVIIIFLLFIAVVILILVGLLPLLSKQLSHFIHELPEFVSKLQMLLTNLPRHFPFISDAQIQTILVGFKVKMGHFGQMILSQMITILPNVVAIVIYLVMVPLLVYFFMMDKVSILGWFGKHFVPKQRDTLNKVWREMHIQIGNYIRGKVFEVIIVGIVTFIVFFFMGLQYSLLLGALVGLSVLIPYIGAVVVTIPVVIVTLLEWGWSPHSLYLMIAYAIIIALDANILVPLLFSEAVSLHPVAIIIAVLIFGGIWGFWGIFFAIPLAALVKALIDNWPVSESRKLKMDNSQF